jgi:RES domain-containing protein
MEMTLFRIQRDVRENSRLKQGSSPGGRWHSGDKLVRYMAESPALAVLEFFKGKRTMLKEDEFKWVNYVLTSWILDLDFAAIPVIAPASLPDGWQKIPYLRSEATRQLGDAWLASRQSPALRVPSSALPPGMGWNVLLNLAHPDFPTPFPPERVKKTPFDLSCCLGMSRG